MKIEIRADSVLIDGYVNAVERDSKVLHNENGPFVEKIKAGTFQRSLDRSKKTGYDVKVLLNHDYSKELTSTRDTSTKIYEDNIGLRCQCEIRDAEVIKKAEEIKNKYAAAAEKAEKAKQEEEKSEITIDDFAKIQFKTALVTACEKVAKSKKLLKLSLKVGGETRTVASGIAEWYAPEELVGKKVVLVYNLKPAKLCGVESQGMILCAEKDGKVCVVSPENGEIPDGATVR